MSKRGSFWFLIGLCLALLWGCVAGDGTVNSFDSAEQYQRKSYCLKFLLPHP
ncbi:MAG: hypothetical protein QNJ70_29305 [Xenococcaceae cyanobacterium MO_207.B15]|nr:hypothetical protein [Xenococcaceae cyanobacterium MO_207.B15]